MPTWIENIARLGCITTHGWCSQWKTAVLGVYVRLKREEEGAGMLEN
jgi:hypothetical protein